MSLLSSFTDDKPNDFFLSFFPSHCSPRFQMSLFAYPYPGIETNFIISSSSIVSSYVWQRKNREIEPLFRKEEETKIKKNFEILRSHESRVDTFIRHRFLPAIFSTRAPLTRTNINRLHCDAKQSEDTRETPLHLPSPVSCVGASACNSSREKGPRINSDERRIWPAKKRSNKKEQRRRRRRRTKR